MTRTESDWMSASAFVLLAACVCASLAACGASEADAEEDELDITQELIWCGEARRALSELQAMQNGTQGIDVSRLNDGETYVRGLATEATAPAAITNDLDAWQGALKARQQSLWALPPNLTGVGGIEPDTSAIDATLMKTLQPVEQRLREWFTKVCRE